MIKNMILLQASEAPETQDEEESFPTSEEVG